VLTSLRDDVLPAYRAVWFYHDNPSPDDRAAESAAEQLRVALSSWRARHHLDPTDPDIDADWIAECARETLRVWSRRQPYSLLSRAEAATRELFTRIESELDTARGEWRDAHARLLTAYPRATADWLWAALHAQTGRAAEPHPEHVHQYNLPVPAAPLLRRKHRTAVAERFTDPSADGALLGLPPARSPGIPISISSSIKGCIRCQC
jgi:hypothetical protein